MPTPTLDYARDRLLPLKLDGFELFLVKKTKTAIDIREQKVDSLIQSQDFGLSIRLLKNQRIGFSYTTSLTNEAIDQAVKMASEIAELMPQDPFANLRPFSQKDYTQMSLRDPKGVKTPLSQKIELAKGLERDCLAADSRVKSVRTASLFETLTEIEMLDQTDEKIGYESSVYGGSVYCKAENPEDTSDQQTGYDSTYSRYLDRLELKETAARSAQTSVELLGAKPAQTQSCPAVIRNDAAADLLSFLSSSFSAEEIDKGRSLLGLEDLGKEVFANSVTIVDDGLLKDGVGTSPFDGEGVPSQKTVLVQSGKYQNLLADVYYANKLERQPTGSSARSIKSPPGISTSNFYLEPGQKGQEALLEEMGNGVLINDLMGLHTANPVTGDFSLGASGFLVKSGKLDQPIKGFAVAGNIKNLFRDITKIGSDLRFFGSLGSPSILVRSLSLGGT